MQVNKKANQLIIDGEIHNMDEIELIGIKNHYYVAIYKKNGEQQT